MKIKPGEYKLENGDNAIVYEILGDKAFGRAFYGSNNSWIAMEWEASGTHGFFCEFDIVERVYRRKPTKNETKARIK